jgi:hypothetical protein
MFPVAADDDYVMPFQLEVEQLQAAFISLQRGKAAGQSGLTNGILKAIAMSESVNPEFIPLMTEWYNMVLRGKVALLSCGPWD